ncbi:MAG: metalloregulator ArsR/SmtB family transcription factor [Oscillospiraceae bacterium]
MTEAETIQLFKCLSDRSRMRIVKALLIEDMYSERLAERLGLSPATVSFHMKKLEEAGLVASHKEQYYTVYSLMPEVLDSSLRELLGEEAEDIAEQQEREEKYRKKVIDSFFEYGKLKSIPTQRKKERIVLEVIAESFQFERLYTEREVNIIIADFHDDFCTIRRDMIAEKLLARDKSGYWRVKAKNEKAE